VLGVILVVVLLAAAAPVGVRWTRHAADAHALAGLFGEPERDRVIEDRSAAVIAGAELCLRLEEFAESARRDAWSGTPIRLHRRSSSWCEWSHPDGSVWQVNLSRRSPRCLRKVVVASADTTPNGVAIRAYQPRTRFTSITLDIRDVRTT
jgi:hypothetical protein